VKVAILDREELKPPTVFRAEESERSKLSTLEAKLKSYEG